MISHFRDICFCDFSRISTTETLVPHNTQQIINAHENFRIFSRVKLTNPSEKVNESDRQVAPVVWQLRRFIIPVDYIEKYSKIIKLLRT